METGEPLVVVSSFTVDGLGGPFVTGIEGDYHNVVGISLPLVRRMLAEVGIPWPALWKTPSTFEYDDAEAARYDESRGGPERARAAAEAVHELLPKGGRVLELAVGTGIVAAELVALGNLVHGVDVSPAMLRHARIRLPGHVAAGDANQLPLADRRCDAVVAIWLLHLLEDSDPVLAEVARILRPDGVFITTTEKSEATRYAAWPRLERPTLPGRPDPAGRPRRRPRPRPRRRHHLHRPQPGPRRRHHPPLPLDQIPPLRPLSWIDSGAA